MTKSFCYKRQKIFWQGGKVEDLNSLFNFVDHCTTMNKKSSEECVECLRFSGTALMFVGAYIAYEGRKLPIPSRRMTTYVVGASISSFALWGAWIRPWITSVSIIQWIILLIYCKLIFESLSYYFKYFKNIFCNFKPSFVALMTWICPELT